MRSHLATLIGLLLLLALLGASCAASRAGHESAADNLPAGSAAAAGIEAPGLPDPLELLAQAREVSQIDVTQPAGTFRFGAQVIGPSFKRNCGDLGTFPLGLNFQPNYDAGGGFGGVAYATYFFNAYDFTAPNDVLVGWDNPFVTATDWYVGLGNLSKNRWDWFAGDPTNMLALPLDEPKYKSPDGGLVLVLAATGHSALPLRWLSLDSPPVFAKLNVSGPDLTVASPHPYKAQLSAVSTFFPGSELSQVDWDFDGDGVFDQVNGSSLITDNMYTDPGVYYPQVRITDNFGREISAVGTVYAYNEVENNDSQGFADILPAFPCSWAGSLGGTSSTNAYDGDNDDFVTFACNDGDQLFIQLFPRYPASVPSLELQDANGNVVALGVYDEYNQAMQLSYGANALDAKPYYLRIFSGGAVFTDYALYGAVGAPPGLGIFASPAKGPTPLTSNIQIFSVPMLGATITRFDWDWEGDGKWDVLDGPHDSAEHSYKYPGVYYPRVRVWDSNGLSAQVSIFVRAGNYTEHENNDIPLMANSLPNNPTTAEGLYGGLLVDPYGRLLGECGADGNFVDYSTFDLLGVNETRLHLSLSSDSLAGGLRLYLYDNDGDLLASNLGTADVLKIDYDLLPGDNAPYFVQVLADTGSSDYQLYLSSEIPTA